MARLGNPKSIEERCSELKAKMFRLNNPQPKPLYIPKTPQLKPGDPINADLARLSFRREYRTRAMVQRVANKYGVTVTHIYRLLRVYEATHTLEFPGDPATNWKATITFMETGVVTSGNRRVAPVRHQL